MIDYFALGDAIVQRLQGIDGIGAIYTPFSIEDMLQLATLSPSISVIYVDDRVDDTSSNGAANVVYQQWLVVLCVDDAGSQLEHTNTIRAQASPFIVEILKRLQGFDPKIAGFRKFKRVSAGVQQMNAAGRLWLPYLFENQMITVY